MAKRAGILVEEFGLGIPPRLFGKKIGETTYTLNALPFGGFVKLYGEDEDSTTKLSERAFSSKSKLTKIIILTAGVVMNLIMGLLAFSIVYTFSGVPRDTGHVKVLYVAENSPASMAGLKENDIIDSLNGEVVTTNDQFISGVEGKKGQEITLQVTSGDTQKEVKVTPRENPPKDEGSLGVAIGSKEIYFPPVWQRPFYGVYYGFGEAIFWSKAVLMGFKNLVAEAFSGHVPKDIAGPIGIYQVTSQATKLGILPLINFLGVLSVNLAILNILPIPALDGGRVFFIVFEAITRRKVTPAIEAKAHAIGFIVLIILLLLITGIDIKRLIVNNQLPAFLQQIFK